MHERKIQRKVFVLLPVLILLIGLGLTGLGVYEVWHQRRLSRDGVRTEGRVIRHRRSTHSNADARPGVSFIAVVEFVDAHGGRHEFEADASGVEDLPVGGPAPVLYLPGSPGSARIDILSKRRTRMTALVLGGLVFTAVGVYMLCTVR